MIAINYETYPITADELYNNQLVMVDGELGTVINVAAGYDLGHIDRPCVIFSVILHNGAKLNLTSFDLGGIVGAVAIK